MKWLLLSTRGRQVPYTNSLTEYRNPVVRGLGRDSKRDSTPGFHCITVSISKIPPHLPKEELALKSQSWKIPRLP